MTDKNIQMSQRNSDNTGWDNLFPKTTIENVQDLSTQLATKANTVQEDWISATLINGATNSNTGSYYPAQYMKDNLGFVHLRGHINGTGTYPLVAFMLPAGYRPTKRLDFSSVGSTNTFVFLRVGSSGNVELDAGSSSYVSLAGVIFKADQ